MRRRTGLLIAVTAGVVLAGAASMLLAEGGAGCRDRCGDVRDRCKQACSSKNPDGMQPACLENCNTEYDSCISGCG